MSLIEPIERAPLEGDEAIAGIPGTHVHDFWRFALPNLQVNTARGWFAEFLVAKAVGLERPVRVEWDDHDVVWEGIRIEVKSSGRMQMWVQKKPSELRFGGLSSRSWTAASVDYAPERSYNADLYVFAVQTSETRSPRCAPMAIRSASGRSDRSYRLSLAQLVSRGETVRWRYRIRRAPRRDREEVRTEDRRRVPGLGPRGHARGRRSRKPPGARRCRLLDWAASLH